MGRNTDELDFLIEYGDQRRVVATVQYPYRVRLKGNGYGGSRDRHGFVNDLMDESLMSQMNPIEISYRNNRTIKRLVDFFQALDNLHARYSSG